MKTILSLAASVLVTFFSVSAQDCNIIYVTPTGSSAVNAGTQGNPASLEYAMSIASSVNNVLWLSAGNYDISTELNVPSEVTIEGGFDPNTWVKSNTTPTIINRDGSNPTAAPANAVMALNSTGTWGVRLQDITINVEDAVDNGVSLYGIHFYGCSDYDIVRCSVTTGAAGMGTDGATGAAGANGEDGLPGDTASIEGLPLPEGGAGGWGGGNNYGGAGATGAKYYQYGYAENGSPSDSTCGGQGGITPSGPACSSGCWFSEPSCTAVHPGGDGEDGEDNINSVGADGANAVSGTVVDGFYIAGAGEDGDQGGHGCGGGGGGSGAGRQRSGADEIGASGGGGGGGGEGGHGGIGGGGGGSSFAIFLADNGANGNIIDCDLTAGMAGIAGMGGQGGAGGIGGEGGIGGPGAGPCGANSTGGNGGAGGDASAGGAGGAGADGISEVLSQHGGETVSVSGITGVPNGQQAIQIGGSVCMGEHVFYSADVSGLWDFGLGASPSQGLGEGPVAVSYALAGRKTIVFEGVTYTDYVGVCECQLVGIANGVSPEEDFRLSFDPTTNAILISTSANSTVNSASIYDALGQLVAQLPIVSGGSPITVNVPTLETGLYIVQLHTEQGYSNSKLVIPSLR